LQGKPNVGFDDVGEWPHRQLRIGSSLDYAARLEGWTAGASSARCSRRSESSATPASLETR
jgi:hypothetical protein